MVEEKTEKHEQEHHESNDSKTITLKKSTLWGVSAFVLLVLLVISVFTGGFGITGKAGANTDNNAESGQTVNLDFMISNPDLYPSLGPENAKATVVELFDFQCPYCTMTAGSAAWTETYKSQYGELIGVGEKVRQLAEQEKIRFILVPLNFLGAESTYAAQASLCAHEQGKYWEMYEAIFKASNGPTENDGKYTKAKLEVIAKSVSGLNQANFKTCLESDATLSDAKKIMSEVQKSGIQIGTPQFFVNGEQVQTSWTDLQAAINAA